MIKEKESIEVEEDFAVWFKENQPDMKNRAMNYTEGSDDIYYAFANFISEYCIEQFCRDRGLDKSEVEEEFTYPVIASDFFTD